MLITLTDNGSYRPDATLSLRSLAADLSRATGLAVHPVSLLHSTKIPPDKLGGQPADILEPFLHRMREEGHEDFLVLPLFFGPSAAIYEYIPQRLEAIRQEGWPELSISVAPCLVDLDDPADLSMAQILADLVLKAAEDNQLSTAAVALCDHGTPRPKVAAVRDLLASQLREILPASRFPHVAPSSMESRDGQQYDYNRPLLEELLGSDGFQSETIISMLFTSPGRHAGPGGDVAQICQAAEAENPGLSTHMADLVGTHPDLIKLLARRLAQAIPAHA